MVGVVALVVGILVGIGVSQAFMQDTSYACTGVFKEFEIARREAARTLSRESGEKIEQIIMDNPECFPGEDTEATPDGS